MQVLYTHVVKGAYKLQSLTDGQTLPTVSGETLKVSRQGGTVTLSTMGSGAGDATATVRARNFKGGQSYVHIVDGLLLPGGASSMLSSPPAPPPTPPQPQGPSTGGEAGETFGYSASKCKDLGLISGTNSNTDERTLLEELQSQAGDNLFVQALQTSDFGKTFDERVARFTVMVPDDDAMGRLPRAVLQAIDTNRFAADDVRAPLCLSHPANMCLALSSF